MILPVKFLWEQLDGPQVTAIENAIFQYNKELFDEKLDYLSNLSVDTANDLHLTFLGILANFIRPIIQVPDKEFFYLTDLPGHGSIRGFADVNDRTVGGRLTGVEGATTESRPLSAEHYRVLLKAYIKGEGEIGSLALLDDICYSLSKLDAPDKTPFYTFEFMYGDDVPENRAPGDLYINIGGLDDWTNPLQIYAVLRGLAKSTYSPVPQLFISMDATVTVPVVMSSLPAGTYHGEQQVELSCSWAFAIIHYTTDGSNPSVDTKVYVPGEPIKITESTTIRAKAYAAGFNSSDVTEFNYIIE